MALSLKCQPYSLLCLCENLIVSHWVGTFFFTGSAQFVASCKRPFRRSMCKPAYETQHSGGVLISFIFILLLESL